MFKKFILALVLVLASSGVANAQNNKVYICHKTSSETNPVLLINVSENAVNAHINNHGDVVATLLADGTFVCSSGDPDPTPF